ncbi:MAG: hypothetical protein KatS3mg121_0269 [Gammaproteobacteria bacterium]|nr:MAG: hypothetical protein KatS3mg121_0269 [Gammaproteobacteria bacterium]
MKPFAGHHGSRRIRDLVADPRDGSVWVASGGTLTQYDLSGALQKELIPELGDGVIRSIKRLALQGATRLDLQIVEPRAGDVLNADALVIHLRYSADRAIDPGSITVTEGGTPLETRCLGDQVALQCEIAGGLADGEHLLTVTVSDRERGLSGTAEVRFVIDTTAPTVSIFEPADGLVTNVVEWTLRGAVSEAVETLTFSLNGEVVSLTADAERRFSHRLVLEEGVNAVTVTALDRAGNSGTATLQVVLDTVAPVAPVLDLIDIGRPGPDGRVTVSARPGSVEANSRVTISNTRTGDSLTLVADADGAFSIDIAAAAGDEIRIVVLDAAGNVGEPVQAPSRTCRRIRRWSPRRSTRRASFRCMRASLFCTPEATPSKPASRAEPSPPDAWRFCVAGCSIATTGLCPGLSSASRVIPSSARP